jgi:pimeloyl-ACP methyl ester carboxylesterase
MSLELEIPTARGPVRALFDRPPEGGRAAVLLVGGADGGFDGPAEALYPTLVEDLAALGIGALRLDFRIHRFPNDPDEGVHDLLHGIGALEERGIERIGLVGHSFGGAVVIEAGIRAASVSCVATLSTQTAGAQRVALLAPKPLLLVHGLEDIRLSPDCSRMLHRMAGEPKRLVLLEGATHSLRQRREDVRRLLVEWFNEHLAARA